MKPIILYNKLFSGDIKLWQSPWFMACLWLTICVAGLFYILTDVWYLRTDLQEHAVQALAILKKQNDYPANFLYYFLILLIAKYHYGVNELTHISVFWVSLAVIAKFVVSAHFIYSNLEKSEPAVKYASLGAFALIMVFALPGVNFFVNGKYYLGQIPPNIWHNSTVIMAMPFVILVFKLLGDLLLRASWKSVLLCLLFQAIFISIKPSYFFVIGVIFPLFALYHHKLDLQFFKCLVPVVLGFLLVIWQYYMHFHLNQGSVYQTEKSSVVLSEPFEIWRHFTPSWTIPFLLITSIAFPLINHFLNPCKLPIYRNLALFSMIWAMALWIFLKEEGPRELHGNFIWQAIICNYLWFMVAITELIQWALAKHNESSIYKFRILLIILLGHFASGIFYILHTFYVMDYM